MAIIKKEIDYAKEVGDVGLALEGLLQAIKQKKTLGEIIALELPLVVAAVDGVAQISDELTANRGAAIRTMGYHTGGLVDAII